MDLQAEKIELVKLLLETEKESLITQIKLLFKKESENRIDEEISQNQKEELDERLARIAQGKTKFHTWEQVEQKLKSVL